MTDADKAFDAILEITKMTLGYFERYFDPMNFDYAGAYKAYADSLSKSVKELSTLERQQAILNVVLSNSENTEA